MSRRQRQLNELRELYSSNAVVRAIDLAFEHFAQFGRDDHIIDVLADAIEQWDVPERTRRLFAELRASDTVTGPPTRAPDVPRVLSTHADSAPRRAEGCR